MRFAKWLLLGILGLATGFGTVWLLRVRHALATQKPTVAAAEPDGRFVYMVELLDSPARGPADAPVTIVEFGAYDCAPCRELERTLNQLADEEPKILRLVWKDAPPTDKTRIPALGARAAEEQDKFWEMHARLMQADSADAAAVAREAKSLGLDAEQFAKAYTKGKAQAKIEAEMAQADNFHVAAPAVFVNGHYIKEPTMANLRAAVRDGQTFAAGLVRTGTAPDRVYSALMRGALPNAGPIGAWLGFD